MEDIALRHVAEKNPDDRGNGKTYRMVLRAILFCSARSKFRVLLVFGNRPAMNYAMEQARVVAAPLQGFAMLRRPANRMEFNNGSSIQFQLAGEDTIHHTRRNIIHDFGIDSSFRQLDQEIHDWLLTILKPN